MSTPAAEERDVKAGNGAKVAGFAVGCLAGAASTARLVEYADDRGRRGGDAFKHVAGSAELHRLACRRTGSA